jgi:hypothetical protein
MTQTTTRRSAMLTTTSIAPTESSAKKTTKRGYVAIKVDFISDSTQLLPCTANKAMTIEGVNGAKVSLKAGEKFYLARAASLGDGWFYIVRLRIIGKKCSCAASKPCRHEIAVQARESERREIAKQTAQPVTNDAIDDLIDPQLPEQPKLTGVYHQTPEQTAHAIAVQAERDAAGQAAVASDVITNGTIDWHQERVETAKTKQNSADDDAPGTLHSAQRGDFLTALFGNSPEMQRYRQEYIEKRRAS